MVQTAVRTDAGALGGRWAISCANHRGYRPEFEWAAIQGEFGRADGETSAST
jgi:hypothetical protein